jgi:hypothetical protein
MTQSPVKNQEFPSRRNTSNSSLPIPTLFRRILGMSCLARLFRSGSHPKVPRNLGNTPGEFQTLPFSPSPAFFGTINLFPHSQIIW